MSIMKVLKVTWLDHATTYGWVDEDLGPVKVTSIGHLVRETKKVLVLTTSLTEGGRVLDPICILKSCVQKRKTL